MNFYEVLGVSPTSSLDEIRSAYKRLALQFHPDKSHGNREMFERIQVAYTALKDPSTRQKIDDLLHSSHNDDSTANNTMNGLVDVFMDILYHQFRKTKECLHGKTSLNDICLTIDINLQEIYQGCIKKVVTKVKRDGKWTRHTCILNLFDFKHYYIFENQGDEHNGDIIIKPNIISPKDHVIMGRDLQMIQYIDLYTYLYGGMISVSLFDVEEIDVYIKPGQENMQVDGYGFPYLSENDDGIRVIKYGNLILRFDINIHDAAIQEILRKEDVRYFIQSHFKK